MSYELVYDRQFIKAEKNNKTVIFPMLYWGSNNCIQYDRSNRGRRERSWSIWTYLCNGKKYAEPEVILQTITDWRQGMIDSHKDTDTPYSDDSFGYFASMKLGTKTTFGMLKGLIANGIKKALTVEQLKEQGISVNIRSYAYNDESFTKAGIEPFDIEPNTGEELIAVLDEKMELCKGKEGISVFVSLDASEYQMKRLRRNLFPKKRKQDREQIKSNIFYTIRCNTVSGFFLKFTKYGFRYAYSNTGGKRFHTEKQAINFHKRMRDNVRFEVEKITLPEGQLITLYA